MQPRHTVSTLEKIKPINPYNKGVFFGRFASSYACSAKSGEEFRLARKIKDKLVAHSNTINMITCVINDGISF